MLAGFIALLILFSSFDNTTPGNSEVSIKAVGVVDGIEMPTTTVKVEEILSKKMHPLLNYIFFAHSDSDIPDRYILLDTNKIKDYHNAKNFSIGSLYNIETLDIYYNILNIIGLRMLQYPNATITLTGCNSAMGFEKGDTDLSRDRARTIADYLSKVWKIKTNRIRIIVRNLPENPSSSNIDKGIAENRRVEIYSDVWEICAPVTTYDTMKTVSPTIIRFYPEIIKMDNTDKWVINTYQQRIVQKSFFGKPPIPKKVEWNINEDKSHIPIFNSPLYILFQLFDSDGNEIARAGTELNVKQITIKKKRENKIKDKVLENFSLIYFDSDKTELSKNNILIAEIINNKLLNSENIIITDYTNVDIAKALAEKLNVQPVEIKSMKDSVELYDSNLPEGRFYNRCVQITAETPIQK